ncbi:MAG: hypothetical protein PF574_00965 [Candidatus Delongbacteria bacterium]|jgi:hypothetical protein|nr:hypothetical protein [Candidatus Delongbacteria bacterium]
MKNLKLLFMSVMIFSSMIFYSCHTETPISVDYESPEVQRVVMYNIASTDTLYDSQFFEINTDTSFVDFNQTLESIDGDFNFDISVVDNGNLYNVTLFAKNVIKDSLVQLGSKRIDSDGNLTFAINVSDFPAIQDSSLQQFYLYFLVSDETDNTETSSELGFDVEKLFIQEKLYNEFGVLLNTGSNPVDFREKVEELTFFQFLAKG